MELPHLGHLGLFLDNRTYIKHWGHPAATIKPLSLVISANPEHLAFNPEQLASLNLGDSTSWACGALTSDKEDAEDEQLEEAASWVVVLSFGISTADDEDPNCQLHRLNSR